MMSACIPEALLQFDQVPARALRSRHNYLGSIMTESATPLLVLSKSFAYAPESWRGS